MSAPNQVQVNIDGKFKLGLTIAVETIPGIDINGIIVQKVDVGSQCEGRIFENDLILCLDQQRLALDRPMDHFQKLLETRRRLGCVFSVTVMRNASPQQMANAANAPGLLDPNTNTMHHSMATDANLHRAAGITNNEASIQMNVQQSQPMPSNPINWQNNVSTSIPTTESVTNSSKAQHPILFEDSNEKAKPKPKMATPSVHVHAAARGKESEKKLGDDIYEIVLEPGPLGLTLVKENRVKRVDPYKQCGGKVEVGDYLIEFDGIDTSKITMEDVTVIAKERAGKRKTAKLIRYNKDRSFITAQKRNETPTKQGVTDLKKESPWLSIERSVDLSTTQEKQSSQHSVSEGKSNEALTQQEAAKKKKAQSPRPSIGNTVDLSTTQEKQSSQRSITGEISNEALTQQEAAKKKQAQSPWPSSTTPGDQNGINTPPQQVVANKKKMQSVSSIKAAVTDQSDVPEIERQSSRYSSDTKESSSHSTETQNKSDPKPLKSRKRSQILCDICRKPDGFLDCMNLQTCYSCGLSVHEDCYGIDNEREWIKYPDWQCHPCSCKFVYFQICFCSKITDPNDFLSILSPAIGKSVKLRNGDSTVEVEITKRATHCVLCPVAQGMHAMTPFYDTHGPKGQPIPAKTKKNEGEGIAWVHSLCAQVLGDNIGTNGTVYGCYDDGLHIGGNELDAESDDDSHSTIDNGIDLDYKDAEGNILITSLLHHFVINREPDQSNRIIQFRRLTCHICKLKDKKSKRIPIQVRSFCISCKSFQTKALNKN